MKCLTAIVAVSVFMGFCYSESHAIDTIGLTPEQTQEVIRNQQYSDGLML